MDRLDSMRVFVAVAESQSFVTAARQLHMSAPAVTRAVAALEGHLGARLLVRSTRSVRTTDAGERFVGDCKRILTDVHEAELIVGGAQVEPQGELSLCSPVEFGQTHMMSLLMNFLSQNTQLKARYLLASRPIHLIEENIDVAVSIAHLADSSMTAVRVGWARRVVVASPTYLLERGEPKTPLDLVKHDAVGVSGQSQKVGSDTPWKFAMTPGAGEAQLQEVAPPRVQLTVNLNSASIAMDAVRNGCGLMRAHGYQVAADVEAGRLRVVLADYEPRPYPIQLVYADGRRASAKVRAFVDFASDRLRSDKSLNPA